MDNLKNANLLLKQVFVDSQFKTTIPTQKEMFSSKQNRNFRNCIYVNCQKSHKFDAHFIFATAFPSLVFLSDIQPIERDRNIAIHA